MKGHKMNINEGLAKSREGTSFKGYFLAKYSDLVSVFGSPIDNICNYKIDAEWIIKTPFGIATIYNYKDGKSYLGNNGLDVINICEWHVGGKNTETYVYIKNEVLKYITNRLKN